MPGVSIVCDTKSVTSSEIQKTSILLSLFLGLFFLLHRVINISPSGRPNQFQIADSGDGGHADASGSRAQETRGYPGV